MLIQGIVGSPAAQSISPGTAQAVRLGQLGDVIASELHGRFYEQTYRGNMFSGGMAPVALSANTITLTATTTPIIAVWNPTTSTVNAVILQVCVQSMINTFTTPVGAGMFVAAVSSGNGALTLGSTPLNRKTLANAGSQCKYFTPATALTGLTNNLVIIDTLGDITSPTGLTYGTIVAPTGGTSLTGFSGVENIDGSIIVPPGGIYAILNTTSTTTMSVGAKILWEEVPV